MIRELLQQGGLSLDRLQSFCLVARAGGVTKAAQGDPARQSLFSRQIKELEEFFGTELIRRKGRGIVLTDAGRRLHVLAQECFTLLSDFKRESADIPREVVIGTGDSLIQWLLLPHLAALHSHLPTVRFKFLNLPTEEAVRRLADGLIDFAIVRHGIASRPLTSTPLGILHYALFVPQGLATSGMKKPGIKSLDQMPLATLEGDGTFRHALEEMARMQKVTLNIQVECSSFTLAARAVARGEVAAILPAIAAPEFTGLAVRQVPLPFLKAFDRKMALVTNPRSLRIRPFLTSVTTTLTALCNL